MQLLNLLVSDRTNQFHLLLCKLPSPVLLNSPYLRFVLELEEALREGMYHRVLAAKSHVPASEYAWFVEGLVERIRNDIIQCLKVAYDSISIEEAKESLLLTGDDGMTLLMAICQLNHWSIVNNVVHINILSSSSAPYSIDDLAILSHNLSYAKQLEAI